MARYGESEAREEARRAGARTVAIDRIVTMVQLRQVFSGRVGLGFGVGQRAFHDAELGVAVEHEFDRGGRHRRHLLRHVGDHPRRRQRHLSRVGIDLAAQQREQRRLATAVGADQPHPVSRVHGQRRVFEQALVATGERKVGDSDHKLQR